MGEREERMLNSHRLEVQSRATVRGWEVNSRIQCAGGRIPAEYGYLHVGTREHDMRLWRQIVEIAGSTLLAEARKQVRLQ